MSNALKRAKNASITELEHSVKSLLSTEAGPGTKFIIKIIKASKLSASIKEALWALWRSNMETIYKSTNVFPWNPNEKRAELFHRDSRFIVIVPNDGQVDTNLIAFAMFRFDIEEDINGLPDLIVYCYELQIAKSFRAQGLGKHLLKILEVLAQRWEMKKVMLTSILVNAPAMQFYGKAGFIIDPISPDGEQYVILSKIIPQSSNNNDP